MVTPDPRLIPPHPPAPPKPRRRTLSDYLLRVPGKELLEALTQTAVVHMQERFDRGFNNGVCVALQVLFAAGRHEEWVELVKAGGVHELLQFATFDEPDEWELAGFAAWAVPHLGMDQPKRRVVRRGET